jgi:uncharacterized protein YeeX (DUF496 family)
MSGCNKIKLTHMLALLSLTKFNKKLLRKYRAEEKRIRDIKHIIRLTLMLTEHIRVVTFKLSLFFYG